MLLGAALVGSLHGPLGVAIGYVAATVALAIPSLAWCVSGTPLSIRTFFQAASRPAVAAVGSALLLVAAAPLLPSEIGVSRLAVSFAVFVAGFLVSWLGVPGGPRAAHELLLAVRELKLRSRP